MNKKELKTTAARARARDKWDNKNQLNKKKRSYKSACKGYILRYANLEELEEVKSWIDEAEASEQLV